MGDDCNMRISFDSFLAIDDGIYLWLKLDAINRLVDNCSDWYYQCSPVDLQFGTATNVNKDYYDPATEVSNTSPQIIFDIFCYSLPLSIDSLPVEDNLWLGQPCWWNLSSKHDFNYLVTNFVWHNSDRLSVMQTRSKFDTIGINWGREWSL